MSFSKDDVTKIIKNLDPNKAFWHDQISIRMFKICGYTIYKPIEYIFREWLKIASHYKIY